VLWERYQSAKLFLKRDSFQLTPEAIACVNGDCVKKISKISIVIDVNANTLT